MTPQPFRELGVPCTHRNASYSGECYGGDRTHRSAKMNARDVAR